MSVALAGSASGDPASVQNVASTGSSDLMTSILPPACVGNGDIYATGCGPGGALLSTLLAPLSILGAGSTSTVYPT
ncbi:hypothetical protein ACIRRA_38310 [Nocardia sp. NPDC101769]|uniref:hypothetical protein n=1 Tax=Nocardia sp. NPDC101769 TaxID=3364333 RepID=UPI0037FF40B4